MSAEAKLKHLEMIQAIIARMAGNAFLVKGWTVTLVTAVLALQGSSSTRAALMWLAMVPVVTFWLLDAYFLYVERLYRDLYDDVRTRQDSAIDFSLSTRDRRSWQSAVAAAFAPTQLAFYAALVIMTLLASAIVSLPPGTTAEAPTS